MIQQLRGGPRGVGGNFLFFFFLNKRERCAVKVELFVPLEITDADGDPQELCVCCMRTQCFC